MMCISLGLHNTCGHVFYNSAYSLSILAVSFPRIISQPTSHKDILPGKAVAFSVQATGTQPLNYQWQWKQFGKKGEKDGWQNLTSQGSTFQVGGVKGRNAGYYRCVVSNCARSETSLCASLTVGKTVTYLSTLTSTHLNCCLSCAQLLSCVTLRVNCMRSMIG